MATYTNIEDAEAAILSNADFEEESSVTKAKAFVSAVKAWMFLQPDSASSTSSSMAFNKQHIAEERQRAQAFIESNTASQNTSPVKFADKSTGWW